MSSEKTIVIAEIGENFLGEMDMALRMIDEAASAGADIVKFQSFRASDLPPNDPDFEFVSSVTLSDDMHRELKSRAEEKGVEFLSSPFTMERTQFLVEQLGLNKIKIASSKMMDFAMLEYLNQGVDTVFLSTGMSNLVEIEEAVSHLERVPNLYILHCCSLYHTRDELANLRAISLLRSAFPDYSVGYSDHTLGIEAAVASVALGARVIEEHFTLDHNLPGTDHILAAEPDELREMVERIRRMEVLLGSPIKQPVPAEIEKRDRVRGRWG